MGKLMRGSGLACFFSTFMLLSTALQAQVAAHPPLEASGYAREMPPGAVMGAAYLTLVNHSPRARRLQKVELLGNTQATAVIHTTVDVDGVSRMRPLAEVTVAQQQRLEMRPGATHLMLHGVQLKAGDKLALRLVFADGETLDLQIPVHSAVAAEHHHHHG